MDFFDLLTVEMFVGLIAGILAASFVRWVFPGPGPVAFEIILVCLGYAAGVAWAFVPIIYRKKDR